MADREHEPDIRFRFGHDFRAALEARDQLDSLLDDPDDVIAHDVRLAASEMVTNVVRHTNGGGEMRAWDPRPNVPLRLEVEDGDPSPPVIPSAPPDVGIPAIGGRGVAIVNAVSDGWGFERLTDGKIVWAEFDRDKRRLDLLPDRNAAPRDPQSRVPRHRPDHHSGLDTDAPNRHSRRRPMWFAIDRD